MVGWRKRTGNPIRPPSAANVSRWALEKIMKLKEAGNCLVGLLELAGLFLVISWPILLMFLWAADRAK